MSQQKKGENMEKIKIGLFLDTFYPMIDGVITVLDNYAKRLNKIADVTVFVPKANNKKYVDNFEYKVVRCQRIKLFNFDYSLPVPTLDKEFMDTLEASNLDIVHIHSPFAIGKLGTQYAKKHKIPCVATLHSQYKQDFYKATKLKGLTEALLQGAMKTFNNCDECWAVNEGTKHLYKTEYKLKAACTIQPNGCDMNNYSFDPEEIAELRKTLANDDEKLLLYVGRIYSPKNIDLILESCSKLKERGFKFKCLLVGGGAELDRYQKMSTSMGLDDVVSFKGSVSDKRELGKYYSAADLFVFPSEYDTDGLVKKEAAAFFTPSILLENVICSYEIKDFHNGYLAPKDADAFAQKIIDALGDNESYKKVCINANKELFISWDDAVKNAYNGYLRLIEEKKQKLLEIETNKKKKKRRRKLSIQVSKNKHIKKQQKTTNKQLKS